MSTHTTRFPGITNDPDKHVLTKRQASRLSAVAHVAPAELAGKNTVELAKRLRSVIDPNLLSFRRICGQVVKADASGNELPVPFATVNVYDVDLRLLAWSPPGLPYSWFFPFFWQREKLATVTTDECGRFCVWIPRFDIDFYLRWRLERRCYLEWLRKPTLDDLLKYREILPPIPQPDPGPLRRPIAVRPLDLSRVMTHAAKLLDTQTVAKVREAVADVRPGGLTTEADTKLAKPAFVDRLAPPDMTEVHQLFEPAMRPRLAARVGVPQQMLAGLDPARAFGPFLRCKLVLVPEWTAVLDVPDLTFEALQDIDGDGQLEVIYQEGLFDVRWDDRSISDVKLYAQANAITGPSCNLPDPGPCGDPSILFAGNYPLQATSAPSPYHDATTGYAKLPNRPDADGVPGGTRTSPAATPMLGNFYLMGCAEKSGATHYRVHHEVAGSTGFLHGSYGPLLKVVGGTLQQLLVSPVNGQWYPIVPRSAGWTPVGILAPVNASGTDKHTFRLELGQQAGATINPIAGTLTNPIGVMVDTTKPVVTITDLAWRQPDTSMTWAPLDPFNCAVMARANTGRVQIRLGFSVTANHLRHFAVNPSGCGPIAAPHLITDARDGLPPAAPDAAAHWHMSASDNSATRVLYYELDAGAPAGCYSFSILASSRAFNPNQAVTGPDPVVAWTNYDPMPVWIQPVVNVALQ